MLIRRASLGLLFAVAYLVTHGVARSIPIDGSDTAAEPAGSIDEVMLGDLNGDGVIGALDFNLFRGCYLVGGPGCENADIDGNQVMDLADLEHFAAAFGSGAVRSVVPEPGTLLLVSAGCTAVAIGRRRLRPSGVPPAAGIAD